MKKSLLTMGLGFFAAASMYAQVTFPVKIGFENADKSDLYHCKFANNVGLSEFGDWVNPHTDQDNWVEQSSNDPKNGDFCFLAENSGDKLNPWDRGFKLANLPIQEGKSYRMSFWLKGEEGKVLKSYISKGVEQLDKSFVNPAGQAVYGLNQDQDYTIPTDEWHHVSFVAFNHGAKPYNDVLANTSWMGGAIVGDNVPESLWAGAGIDDSNKGKTYRDFWNGTIPEIYFAIINVYDAGQFQIDDIVIEEDKYFNQATFNGNIIKLDFGYQTNIAALAQANKRGYQKLDVNQFKVVKNGAELEIASAEAQADGFVYLFLSEGDAEGATISYTPAEDSPLQYGADKRPSNSSDALPVYGFENEVTYEDLSIEAEGHIGELPNLEASTPVDGAFDLDGNISEITLTFDITVDPEASVISLTDEDGNVTTLTAKAGADDKTLVIALPKKLADSNYTLDYEVANETGDATYDKITFNVGKFSFDPQQSTDVVFDAGFENDNNGTVPTAGRLTFGGNVLNPGEGRGSGARLFTDFAQGGDFTAALYSRDWDGDGQYEVGLGEEVVEIKNPGKYQLSFAWAQWKNGATMKEVTIFKVDEEGNEGDIVWQNEAAYTGAVDVNGGKGAVSGAHKEAININIDEPGRYGFRFKGTGEWLLANVKFQYLPNLAGIDSKSNLWAALEPTYDFYYGTIDENPRYDGEDYDNLKAVMDKYMDDDAAPTNWAALGMHTAADYNVAIEEIKAALQGAKDYKDAVDVYDGLRIEGGEVEQAILNNADEKVARLECYTILKETYETYKDKELTDKAEMQEASAIMKKNLNMVNNMKGVKYEGGNPGIGQSGIPALTHRVELAKKTIESMNAELSEEDVEILNSVDEAISDDDLLAAKLMKIATAKYYTAMIDPAKKEKFFEAQYDEEGEEISNGTYDFSFFLKNSNIYIQTAQEQIAQSLELVSDEEAEHTVYQGAACPGWTFEDVQGWSTWSTGWSDHKSADYPVEAMASNWNGSYTIKQSIENLPAGLYILKGGVSERDTYHEDSYFFWQTSNDDDIVMMSVPNAGQTFPNLNMSSARINAFFNEGNEVTEDEEGNPIDPAEDEYLEILDGKLTIGAHASTSDSHIFINNFAIYLVGGADNFDYKQAIETGIENVKSDKLVNVAVYDLNGRQIVRAAKGVNIVKRTYGDGSVKVGKYLVK